MFFGSYFIYCALTFLLLLCQGHGQTCGTQGFAYCENKTDFRMCVDGKYDPENTLQSCGPLYCCADCEGICWEFEECCPQTTVETTVIESSSTSTMAVTTTTETTTELTTEKPSTTETPPTTTTTTIATTESTTEVTTNEPSTTEAPTTTPVATTETTTQLTTEDPSTTEASTTTTMATTTTELTTKLTTEDPSTTEVPTTTTTVMTTETTAGITTEEPSTTAVHSSAATTVPATSIAPTDVPPTEAPFNCESAGEFQDLENCTNFYLCIPLSSGDFVHLMFSCPDGSQFDSATKKCSQNATCITPSCNDFGFYCISTSQVQLCSDSKPPSGDTFTCPTNTYCSMDCQYPCWADVPCKVNTESPLTSTRDLPTSTVTLLPSTTTAMTTTTTTTTTTRATTTEPFVCSETGRFSDPTNCSLYYLCSPKSSGGFYTMHFACPSSSLFNPNTRQCSSSNDFKCSVPGYVSTSGTTLLPTVAPTPQSFTCEKSGRFADPVDCKSYYLCSPKSSGGFYELHFQCSGSSSFNPDTSQCSTSSSANC